MKDPRRILLIRPSALGDVCRTVPVLVSLKQRFPASSIDWLVETPLIPAVEAHPDLHAAVPFPRDEIAPGRLLTRAAARRRYSELKRSLREPGYDLVIDAQGLTRSGLMARLTRAPRRVGYAAGSGRELAWIGANERYRVPRELHAVDRMLALVEAAGIPPVRDIRLYAPPADRARLDPALAASRFVLIAPTSQHRGKNWPAERFAAAARAILDAGAAERVVITAARHERDQCGPLLELASRDRRVIDMIGGAVGALMALVERAALVIANDSAALHMAVGFDRPLIGLYGPTRVDLVGPYRREADVIQPFTPPPRGVSHKDERAGRALMERIPVEEVISAAMKRLSVPSDRPTPPLSSAPLAPSDPSAAARSPAR